MVIVFILVESIVGFLFCYCYVVSTTVFSTTIFLSFEYAQTHVFVFFKGNSSLVQVIFGFQYVSAFP